MLLLDRNFDLRFHESNIWKVKEMYKKSLNSQKIYEKSLVLLRIDMPLCITTGKQERAYKLR